MEEGFSRERGANDPPRRPHHGTVVAWLALFVALGGVASGLPGKNTVGRDDIRSGAVRSSEIHSQAVRSKEIRNATIKRADIAAAAIGEAQLLDGAVTPGKIGTVPAARVDTPQEGPACTSQVISSNASEVVQFSMEAFDTQALHEDPPPECAPVTQSRLTAPIRGVYVVSAGLSWSLDDDGRRQLEILQSDNGDTQMMAVDQVEASSTGATVQALSTIVGLDASDSVEARGTQNSGDSLTLGSGPNTYLSMAWLSPLTAP
jgi:hypothetical protein